jgi:hypothetical protein
MEFLSQVVTIVKALKRLPKTAKWKKILSLRSSEEWAALIVAHTPEEFKSILESEQFPDLAKLMTLPWSDTKNAGVYGWVLRPKDKEVFRDDERFLYTGSASAASGGLKGKKGSFLSSHLSRRDRPLMSKIEALGLSPTEIFVTFFEIPLSEGSDEEVYEIKVLTAVARAVIVVRLGGLGGGSKPAIMDQGSCNLKDIRYWEMACHNPFLYDIPSPEKLRKRREDKKKALRIAKDFNGGTIGDRKARALGRMARKKQSK